MSGWKIVPVVPTGEMIYEGFVESADPQDVWQPMLDAAPRASEDEALVEKVAEVIYGASEYDIFVNVKSALPLARAVIKMLEAR